MRPHTFDRECMCIWCRLYLQEERQQEKLVGPTFLIDKEEPAEETKEPSNTNHS